MLLAQMIHSFRLPGFCRALRLTPPQQVAVGLGLSRSPNPGVAKEGVKFLVARVPGLVSGGGGQLSLEALHSLLELVKTSEEVSAQVSFALPRRHFYFRSSDRSLVFALVRGEANLLFTLLISLAFTGRDRTLELDTIPSKICFSCSVFFACVNPPPPSKLVSSPPPDDLSRCRGRKTCAES